MKYLYTCLVVLCSFAVTFAQPTFTITPSTTSVDPGTSITFDVTVSGFDEIISSQFGVRWDPNVLGFISVDNPNSTDFPGLGGANFGTAAASTDAGSFNLSWLENSLAPITVADGTRMFSFTLASIGGGTTSVEVDPTQTQEVIDVNFEDIGLMSSNTSISVSGDSGGGATCTDGIQNGDETGVDCGGASCPACVSTPTCMDGMQNGSETGVDCGGSCPPCNTGGSGDFGLSAPTVTAMPGAQICLDVSVRGFADLVGMQYSMNWDVNVLEFVMVQSITTELPEFTSANISLTEIDEGALRVSWNPVDASIGYNTPDGTVLYQICFNAVGDNGTSSSVAFTSSPLTVEVIDVNLNLVDATNTNGLVNIQGDVQPPADCPADASPFCMENATGNINETTCVSISAQNFENIVSFQHSISFNATNLEFVEIMNPGNLAGLADANLSTVSAGTGTINVSWLDPNVSGVTLADDTELYQLCFIARADGTHPISFTENPVAFEVSDGNGNIIPFNGADGSICVGANCASTDVCAGVPAIGITGTMTNVDCRGDNTGGIDISATGGGGGYSYDWGTATSEDLNNITAGTYTVTVTAMCGTPASMTFTLTEPSDGVAINANVTGEVSCFGETTGAIEVTASGGTGTITFDWTGAGTATGVANQTGLAAGSYTVVANDDSGCAFSQTIMIPGPTAALAADPNVQDVGCGGGSDGAINLNITGGTAPYMVMWDDTQTGENRTGLVSGSYAATVTDANNCTLNVAALTLMGSGATITATSNIVAVSGDMEGSIDLSVTGGTAPYTYAWTGPTGFAGATTEDLANLMIPGSYVVVITDAAGCSVTETYSQAQPLLFDAQVQNACDGAANGGITMLVSGGVLPYTYAWTNEGNPAGSEESLANVGAGTYIFVVTDGAGTERTATYTIEISPAFEVTPAITDETDSGINDNGAISLTVAGGTGTLTYTWADDATATMANRTGLTTGDYIVTITDANGCTQMETFTVGYVAAAPIAGDFVTTDATCAGIEDGSLSFSLTNGDPNYVVSLVNADGFSETMTLDQYNPIFTRAGLAAGRYDATIVDGNGAEITTTITIAAPDAFSVAGIVASATDDMNCNGSISLNVSGGSGAYDYAWSTGAVSRDLIGICPTDYIVTITDANGCSQVESFNLTLLAADAVTNPTLCPEGDATGNIDLNINGGTGPFTYSWTGPEGFAGATTEDLTGVPAGDYTVVITEVTNVSITETFTVGSTSTLAVNVMNDQNQNGFGVSCNGAQDAALIAVGMNSQAYAYAWTDANGQSLSSMANLSNVGAGMYTVQVTDNQNCVVTSSIDVIEPTALTTIMDVLDINCNGDGNGEAMIVVDGGVRFSDNDYQYAWSHVADNDFPAALGLLGGTYVVTVTDANNCTIVDSLIVTEPDSLIINTTITPFTQLEPGEVSATVSGGTAPYRYEWVDMATTSVVGVTAALSNLTREATLTLRVTDVNGCEATVQSIDVFNLTDCLTSTPVITPNGDGKNELFVIQCLGLYPDNTLEIYSRWGQLVHTQASYDNSWSARDSSGLPLPSGAYFYVFSYTDQNGNEALPVKGAITILNE